MHFQLHLAVSKPTADDGIVTVWADDTSARLRTPPAR
jgi:hypothetical protein